MINNISFLTLCILMVLFVCFIWFFKSQSTIFRLCRDRSSVMCLAQGHKAVTPVMLKPTTPQSRVKHWATVLPLYSDGFSHKYWYNKYGIVHFALLGVKAILFWITVYFCPWKFDLILANSADPDEMQHHAAFHMGHHLAKVPVLGFPVYKGLKSPRSH